MSKKAQLIWNFKGQDGLKTAEHHLVHLKEFAQMEALPILNMGLKNKSFIMRGVYNCRNEMGRKIKNSIETKQGIRSRLNKVL